VKLVLPDFSAVCIDDGNTRCKVGVFLRGELSKLYVLPTRTSDALFSIPEIKEEILPVIWSSVSVSRTIFENLHRERALVFEAGVELDLPIKNRYRRPGPGSDRLCAAVAAHAFFKGSPVLAIDAGTCLKFDFVSAGGVYLGGSISPGLQMRYDSMHRGTGRLPLLSATDAVEAELVGDHTEAAMRSGALLGIRMETEGRIARYHSLYPDVKVILTGGGLEDLRISLKKNIFAEPNLVLYGLLILLYHQPKIKALIHS
jgi:type III pantothenate kinase